MNRWRLVWMKNLCFTMIEFMKLSRFFFLPCHAKKEPDFQGEEYLKILKKQTKIMLEQWYNIAESYSERHLTFDRDRLLAIAGIARWWAI